MSLGTNKRAHTAHIWFDAKGEILAVGQVPDPTENDGTDRAVVRRTVQPLGASNHSVIEVDVGGENLERLHETHCIDVRTRMLVPKALKGT